MTSDIFNPMEGTIMCCEKNCYFCKNLCFFDYENVSEYFCTVSGLPYQQTKLKMKCNNYTPDFEE
jgi:hypothetical protein